MPDPSFQREPLAQLAHCFSATIGRYREEFIRTMESTALALLIGFATAVVAVTVLTGNWLERRMTRRWSHLQANAEDGPLG